MPITFVGYWGVGPRTDPAEPDYQALARLGSSARPCTRSSTTRPPISCSSSLMSMRGAIALGSRTSQYLQQIAALAVTQGLETRWLSQLWETAGYSDSDVDKLMADPEVLQAWQAFPCVRPSCSRRRAGAAAQTRRRLPCATTAQA